MEPEDVVICIAPDGDGFYAFAPKYPGMLAGGDTIAETKEYMADCAEAYFQSMHKHSEREPIPARLMFYTWAEGDEVTLEWNR